MGRPAHATWYVPRVSVPPALQALTCRLGAAARPCNVRACSHPRRCRSGDAPTLYIMFLDPRCQDGPAGPCHFWYVPRVSVPPALQALTCRLGAAAHPCNVRAFSYPGRCRSGDAPTLYNVFESAMPRWPGRPMPLGMCLEYAYHPL